jgi:hypothetical protein
MTKSKFEVHYEDGEIVVTGYKESIKLFEAQQNGGRRCYVQPVVFPYKEP